MKKFLEIVYQDEELTDEVYIQGFGFVSTKTKEVTKLQITKITNIFSLLLIGYLILRSILFRPFALLFNYLSGIMFIGYSFDDGANFDLISTLAESVSYVTSFSLVIFIGYYIERNLYKKDILLKKVDVRTFLVAIIITLGMWTIGNFVAIIFEDLFKIVGIINAPAFESISLKESIVNDNLILLIFMSILQELFFRGIVLFKLREFGDTFAIIATSILFSSISTEFLVGIKWFILSLALCYFTLQCNNIIVAIVCRLVCSISFQSVRIIFYNITNSLGSVMVISVICVALLFALYYFFKLDFKLEDIDTNISNGEKIFMFISSFSFIALAIVSIFKAQEVLQFIG